MMASTGPRQRTCINCSGEGILRLRQAGLFGACCGFEATVSVGIAGEWLLKQTRMCNKREESLEAMTMLTTTDDDDDVLEGAMLQGEPAGRRREKRDGTSLGDRCEQV